MVALRAKVERVVPNALRPPAAGSQTSGLGTSRSTLGCKAPRTLYRDPRRNFAAASVRDFTCSFS